MKKVFVSWSGELGRVIAEKLKVTILDTPELDVWVSSEGIQSGAPWFQEIEKAAQECDIAIGCLTPGAASRPWVNFEAGMLYGKLRNFKIILIGEQLQGPLTQIQAIDGTDKNQIKSLLSSPTVNPEQWHRLVDRTFDDWARFVNSQIEKFEYQSEFNSYIKSLQSAVDSLCSNAMVTENICLRTILNISMQNTFFTLNSVSDRFQAPQSHYPSHLIKLQRDFLAHVKAIAIVQKKEQFWQKLLGQQIRDTASKFSKRIFVLRDPDQLQEHWEMLVTHAKAYQVYILSYDNLVRGFEDKFVQDFSILEIKENKKASSSKVLAIYDKADQNNLDLSQIQYIGDNEKIKGYEAAFDQVIDQSIELTKAIIQDLDIVSSRVFGKSTSGAMSKRITEMSEYVSVEDYDRHEEEHAYYQEMMGVMLEKFSTIFDGKNESYEVLEFGAGTGIFTRRLLSLKTIEKVAAVEIDWGCYLKLQNNMRCFDNNQYNLFYEDSRFFNPPGRYHAVFSSFADHHIRHSDKKTYLDNVRNNLLSGAVFIVGDEFIPEYEKGNKSAREVALKAYHNHIIKLAEEAGNTVLIELETAALTSGLDEIGDFKVTCNEYEEFLLSSGFKFEKIRIGPESDELARVVGGVYVYIARVSK